MGRSKTKSLAALFRPQRARRAPSRSSSDPSDSPAVQAIRDVIARVPWGRVSTYGEIARAAGYPGRARQTGYALRHTPDDVHLPWHRIVGAGGRIAFPRGSRHHREQARLLRSEGVAVKDGRVALAALLKSDEF
ncbi:MAG TPA: MGMT family protein [Steroidobacteraceae bacterium]|nr:MGMT family protein [Steroidobacteraceae bacterium]